MFSYYENMRVFILALTTTFLISCGGGGGGGSAPSAPALQNITVSLTSSAESAEVNSSITLTWSSTLATSCSASGSWSGSKGTSGSESITIGVGGSNTFSLSCSASGANSGSASTTVNGLRYFDGKVFDGYIRGAEVFVDTNENLTLDANEATVTTDNQGNFTQLLFGNGTLVSKGGFDLDTGADLLNLTLVHKLEGYEASKLASPFTTMIAYMSDASIINAALGIDASIDLLKTDPIPNLGEGIYDQMYEKGNQLTVLSYTLQNHSNAVDGNSKIYFQAIANQLEESYGANQESVDIEDPTFISNVIDKVEAARDATFESDVKTNLNTIISSTIPLLKVYSDSNTTSSVQRFAFSTLQNDVKDSTVMTGNASPTLLKYENNIYDYVASDQGISESDITPIDNTEVDEPISNQAPTINSSATFSLAENNIAIGDISASDPDGDSLTYSISGSEINISNSGALTFSSAPDYETKNSYSATVTVSDGAKSTTQGITVNIGDINLSASQIGSNIIGEANNGNCYKCIQSIDTSHDIDTDGDTILIGRNGSWRVSGWATVYQKNGSSWSEMPSTKLTGAASGSSFGRQLEIDGDGLVLIGSGAGLYVFPFELVDGTWIRNPDYVDNGPIFYSASGDGQKSIRDISLSSNGNVMSYIYEKTGGDPNFTKLFVHDDQDSPNYTFNDNSRRRAEITISESTAFHKKHVLNSDGSYIAAAQNNANVIVYEWDGTNYTQKGDLISSCSGLSGSYSQVGLSGLAISDDGQIIAIHAQDPSGGTPGAVCVYSWSGTAWSQQGDTIVGSNNSDSLSSVAISGNGNRLALGSRNFDNNIGKVSIFDWSIASSNWKQSGADILGEAANSDFGPLSLSGDGRTIVISSTPSSGNFGQVQVFDLPVN